MEKESLQKLLTTQWQVYDMEYETAIKQLNKLKEIEKERELELVEMFDKIKLENKVSFNLGAKSAICEILLKI